MSKLPLSIEEQLKERMEWAVSHGLNKEELNNILFVATEDGKPLIICIENINNWHNELFKNGIVPAIIYDGLWHTGISTKVNVWDLNGSKPQFKKYQSNATIGLTIDQCVEAIINDCNGVVIYL